MIKSMTGFASNTFDCEDYSISIEMKTVNHRFCDISIKAIKELAPFEIKMRKLIKDRVKRGKVEVYINIRFKSKEKINVGFDFDLAQVYIKYMNDLADMTGIKKDYSAYDIANMPNVLCDKELEIDGNFEKNLISCLEDTITKLDNSRIVEGDNLKNDLSIKVSYMEEIIEKILRFEPEFLQEYKENLILRINEQLADVEISEEGILTEVAILTDKMCIDEELVRLRSHINQIRTILDADIDENGRKLDFIIQELNRESNTILSKSSCLDIVNYGIELKSNIEKIREQVQNLL